LFLSLHNLYAKEGRDWNCEKSRMEEKKKDSQLAVLLFDCKNQILKGK